MNSNIDLNKFRSLIPISSLFDENIVYLAGHSTVRNYQSGEQIFECGETDEYSLFLLSGEVRLKSEENRESVIQSGTEKAQYAMANLKPRHYDGFANLNETTVVKVGTQLIDKMMAWGQIVPGCGSGMQVTELSGPDAENSGWMMSMLLTRSFLKLPGANIEKVFELLEEKTYKAGETVISQGEEGNYYYIIKEGSCQVLRKTGALETPLAVLESTKSFGEEALLSNTVRNATVRMKTDGKLMRLGKKHFLELMREPQLNWVDLKQADELIKKGAVRIDVRLENEFKNSGNKRALNIPLYLLRLKMGILNPKKRYIVYCDTGERSSAAAFIMSDFGLKVYVLQGGLASCAKKT